MTEIFPAALLYLIPLERAALALASFMLILFTGARHLQSVSCSEESAPVSCNCEKVESNSYRCANPAVFCLAVSLLIAVSSYFEVPRFLTCSNV